MRAASSGSGSMVRPAAMWTVVTTSSAALWLAGRHVLPAPPVAHPGELASWWSDLGPVTATFAAARAGLVAVTAMWVLALTAMLILRGVTTIGLRLPGSLERCLTRAAAGRGRRLLLLILGVSTSGGLFGGCGLGGAASTTAAAPPAGLRDVPPPVLLAPTSVGPAGGPAPAVTTGVGSVGAVQAGAPKAEGGAAAKQAGAPKQAIGPSAGFPKRAQRIAAGPAPPHTWTVRPGDDFWSIAEAVVTSSGGRPDPGGVARYWSRLVAANRRRLPLPGDPNLLFPGDVIVLPPVYGPST